MKRQFAIWGSATWGRTFKRILEEEGEDFISFIDNDKSKWGKDVVGFDEFCANNNLDEVAILLSLRKWENIIEVQNRIRERSQTCEILYHYDLCKDFGNKHIKDIGYNIQFEQQFKTWLDNVDSEMKYWAKQVVSEEGAYHSHYLDIIGKENFAFLFAKEEETINSNDIILDVGCGVCSQYGDLTANGKKVKILGVDPLAAYYNSLNDEFAKDKGIYNKKTVGFGFLEFLSYSFGSNYADAICIDNALDHCIDPLSAILQAIDVVKPDKNVRIRCYFNEGYREMYNGLHRWNVSIHEDDFVVWNNENYVNVSKAIEGFADIKLFDISPEDCEEACGYVACKITKRKPVPQEIIEKTHHNAGVVMEALMKKIVQQSSENSC